MQSLFIAITLLVWDGVECFMIQKEQLQPGGRSFEIRNPDYPWAGVTEVTYSLTSTPGLAIKVDCSEMAFYPTNRQSYCAVRLDIRDSYGTRRVCQAQPSTSFISTSNWMQVAIVNGWYGRTLLRCQVSGVTDSNYRSPFFSTETEEEDSSEAGGPPGRLETTCPCGWANKAGSRIVAGKVTKPNEYPFMIALINGADGKQWCGGSIVTEYHILTAAHCTDPFLKNNIILRVSIGAHQVQTYSYAGQMIDVKQIIQHDYQPAQYHLNDITVLVLAKPIVFSKYVGRVCLSPTRINLDKKTVKVMGWGRTSHFGTPSSVLKEVNLRVVPTKLCARNALVKPTSETQICAHGLNKGSCMGDSGGPLVWLDPDTNRYTLVGLVSFGRVCGSHDPSVYTDVSAYYDWIQQKINETTPEQHTCSKK